MPRRWHCGRGGRKRLCVGPTRVGTCPFSPKLTLAKNSVSLWEGRAQCGAQRAESAWLLTDRRTPIDRRDSESAAVRGSATPLYYSRHCVCRFAPTCCSHYSSLLACYSVRTTYSVRHRVCRSAAVTALVSNDCARSMASARTQRAANWDAPMNETWVPYRS